MQAGIHLLTEKYVTKHIQQLNLRVEEIRMPILSHTDEDIEDP
jgi:hypothetical protein